MSLHGMKEINKKKYLLIFTCCIFIFFIILIITPEKKQVLENNVFYERIYSLSKTTETVMLNDIFNFDFDKAYIVNIKYVYADEEYFIKELDVKTNVNILSLENEMYNRILFIKNNAIIYDFIYDIRKLKIKKTDIWIYPNTTVAFTQHNFIDDKEKFIQLEFINTNN